MQAREASQSQNDTQTTVSSLEVPLQDGNEAEQELRLVSPKIPSPTATAGRPRSPSPSPEVATASEEEDADAESMPTGNRKRDYDEYRRLAGTEDDSQTSETSERAPEVRMRAFQAMLGNVRFEDWQSIGLLATDDNHTAEEEDLGLGLGC